MRELFKFFLILGSTGFGGPLSLVQLMREKFVDQDKKISHAEFDQVFTMIKAMPGPVAFQMAVYLGRYFYGFWGGAVAAIGLIFPPFVMIVLIGIFYEDLAAFTTVQYALKGFLFSVSAIILLSLRSMVMTSYRSILFWIIISISFYLSWKKYVPEPLVIIGFGTLVALSQSSRFRSKHSFFSITFLMFDWEKITAVFRSCAYAGTFVFGTGLAILPVLRVDFVDLKQWLPLQEFNDGVIFGQMTPGPVTITASFLGYRISGFAGALAATSGVFLMPFIHMVTWFPTAVRWLGRQLWLKPFLLGASAAVIGSILETIVRMNIDSYRLGIFWFIFIGTIILLVLRPKTPLLAIILISGLINLLLQSGAMSAV